MRRASCAAPKVTIAGSGLPKVGAPDCIDIDAAKVPVSELVKWLGDPHEPLRALARSAGVNLELLQPGMKAMMPFTLTVD